MAPVTEDKIVPKRTNGDESDEGFVSPSVGLRNHKDSIIQSESESGNSSSDNDSQAGSSSATTSSESSQALQNSDEEMEENTTSATGTSHSDNKNSKDEEAPHAKCNSSPDSQTAVTPSAPPAAVVAKEDPAAESKAEQLAKFVVYSLLEKHNGDSSDKVERTLLRCVKMMMQKHEILFKGMMKRVQVTRETGYVSFVTVANTLFEEDKMVITWSRIVALYAFGGQLALYCKEKGMEDFACTVADFMGKYAKEVLTPFVTNIGGWSKICDEFPEETDLENRVRRVLSWTAVGLGVAATVSYLTSR
ncbi:bcl-2-like protein 1 [Macrobrachium nipponense]|uniref:bcl-2-like protein 1 n=1 Tax=Macrobrachium nipponense TaxID=159736 RepID=UPI0030C83E89